MRVPAWTLETITLRVTILGTSSAIPTFKRGLSGTVLERDGESFLFDCGEGTQFQIMRGGIRRGKLRTILITHLHGDHFYGLPGLLSSFNLNQRAKPLDIYGPRGLKKFLDFMMGFPKRQNYTYPIQVHEIAPGYEGVLLDEEEFTISTLPLDHRLPTHGYRLEEKPLFGHFDSKKADKLGVPWGPERRQLQQGENVKLEDGRTVTPDEVVGPPRQGKSFVYCTDTAFCVNAKRLAQDCDLLVHEATFNDEMAELALERKHSTIRQAATVAQGAGARKFIATHFSTRFDKTLIVDLEKEGREVYPDLLMAKDLMTVEF